MQASGGAHGGTGREADCPAAVIALGATIHTNLRSIAADDWFVDRFETALEDGELTSRVDFPISAPAFQSPCRTLRR